MTRLLCVLVCIPLIVVAQVPDQAGSLFEKARALIDANCAACTGRSQPALEEGLRLALQARDAGYRDQPAVLRLLVDGYGTLGAVFLKLGDPQREEAFKRSADFLKQLVEAKPADANIRYESVHRVVGNVETIRGTIDERIREYRYVLTLDPAHEKARFDLAQDLFRMGEDDEAIRLLQGLVASSAPENARIYSQRLENFLTMKATSKQVVEPVKITGEVAHGMDFEQEFASGLVFRLSRVGELGWEIQIGSKNSIADYAFVLTPPYRGQNPRFLYPAWDGRTSELFQKGTSVRFRFVRNQQDYDRAEADVQTMLGWSVPDGQPYKEALERASRDLDEIPYCVGLLRIVDSSLIRPGVNPQIDWLRFEAELCGKQRY